MAVGGVATHRASRRCIAPGQCVARAGEAQPKTLGLTDGRFAHAGTNSLVGLADVARFAKGNRSSVGLARIAESADPPSHVTKGCNLVFEVEIRSRTGGVKIFAHSIVEEIGNVSQYRRWRSARSGWRRQALGRRWRGHHLRRGLGQVISGSS